MGGVPQPIGLGFHLADLDPASTQGVGKEEAEREIVSTSTELSDLQERLYAESVEGGKRSVLLVLQGIDTAGKGGIIRHVVGQVDPQGIHIHAFKAPTPEEARHDFLWRIRRALPAPGHIGVFDRSHYEDVLIRRVRSLDPADVIEARYGAIRDFEAELVANGTAVRKVMLQITREEQKARLGERLDRPDKHWKFSPADIDERMLWEQYQGAYQIALERTATPEAPWFVIPANHKWYSRWAVHMILLDALRGLDPQWPQADFDVDEQKARLALS